MTGTTDTVRNQGFSPVASDLPPEMTLAQYRGRRRRPTGGRVRRTRRREARAGRR